MTVCDVCRSDEEVETVHFVQDTHDVRNEGKFVGPMDREYCRVCRDALAESNWALLAARQR